MNNPTIAANVWRYAAYRFIITNFSAYKYIQLIALMLIFTTNCGMQYERVLGGVDFHQFFFTPSKINLL